MKQTPGPGHAVDDETDGPDPDDGDERSRDSVPYRGGAEREDGSQKGDVAQRRAPSAVPFRARNQEEDVQRGSDQPEPETLRRKAPARDREKAEQIERRLECHPGGPVEHEAEESAQVLTRPAGSDVAQRMNAHHAPAGHPEHEQRHRHGDCRQHGIPSRSDDEARAKRQRNEREAQLQQRHHEQRGHPSPRAPVTDPSNGLDEEERRRYFGPDSRRVENQRRTEREEGEDGARHAIRNPFILEETKRRANEQRPEQNHRGNGPR